MSIIFFDHNRRHHCHQHSRIIAIIRRYLCRNFRSADLLQVGISFGLKRWALLAKVTIFGPKKWHFEWPNQNSKTTFIVQTFPKYGPYDFYLVNLSLLGAILTIFQFCGFSGLYMAVSRLLHIHKVAPCQAITLKSCAKAPAPFGRDSPNVMSPAYMHTQPYRTIALGVAPLS